MTHTANLTYVGKAGHIAGYDVLISSDTITVSCQGQHVTTQMVSNHGTSIMELANRPGFRLGWGLFPDDAEAIYCYDRDDGNFGYAINLSRPDCSEWGYCNFTTESNR